MLAAAKPNAAFAAGRDFTVAENPPLFDVEPAWAEHWRDMPEFIQEDQRPASTIRVYFATDEDRRAFFDLVGLDPSRSRAIWYPNRPVRRYPKPAEKPLIPQGRYPVYVISKGRWETRYTSRALDELGLDYHIVVEPQEAENYAQHVDERKILTLPFSNLGQGSIPARNWVWDHAVSTGATRHWILDDNLKGFIRLNNNARRLIREENPLIPMETFADRYQNVALIGPNYDAFVPHWAKFAPFRLNTRVYSCILINHDLPFRWRGRYNEDTDLSLRALKAGWTTVLFNAYLIFKVQTMTMGGGNTDELYKDDGRLKMAESLREQHPDVVTVTTKWGRPQHHVDYSPFRFNKLIPVESHHD